jgi:CMP-N,N'-diacetyllegionaminic acid synthase
MINGLSVLAFIPARGGSKGLPRKNLLPLAGKPLIVWTIEAAHESTYIDHVVLSSENEEIIEVGRKWGCNIPFLRPVELANDEARTVDVLHHLLLNLDQKYDLVVQLQPTSPFRNAMDINAALEYCLKTRAPACVSVSRIEKSPHWTFSLSDTGKMSPILPPLQGKSRRQEMTAFFELNGAIYIGQSEWIAKRDSFLSEDTVAYVMPADRSLDIDTDEDLVIAEIRARQLHKRNLNYGA